VSEKVPEEVSNKTSKNLRALFLSDWVIDNGSSSITYDELIYLDLDI
jgi:hypothetical protein